MNKEVQEVRVFLKSVWWVIVIRAIVLIIFGLFAMIAPTYTALGILLMFGVYLIIDGIIDIFLGFGGIGEVRGWFWWVLKGLVAIGVGVFALMNIAITIEVTIMILGIAFILRGILEIIALFGHESTGGEKVLVFVAGILNILAGMVLMIDPFLGGEIYLWVVGLFSIIGGGVLLAFAFRAKKEVKEVLDEVEEMIEEMEDETK